MNNISDAIRTFISKYNLESLDSPYLVAFSGGYDSMCLLDALSKITDKKVIAIHLNHNWRGEESKREENYCREFCKKIGVEIYVEELQASTPKTETAARDARYLFFQKCADKFSSQIIFTAHNADDNAETLIYRIIKGSAIDGLCGIAEHRDIYYRPLLTIGRKEIEKYCTENKLQPNQDSSNSNIKYKRNFIRQKIMPHLKEINENAVESINSLAQSAQEDCEVWYNLVNDIGNSTVKFINSPTPVQNRYIKKLLTSNRLDYDKERLLNIKQSIFDFSNSKSGKTLSLSAQLMLFVNNKRIEIIKSKITEIEPVKIKTIGKYHTDLGTLIIEETKEIPKNFPKDRENLAFVDLDNIDFTLRTRKDGDIIYPLGSGGSQKLKKYLNEKKIPQHEKSSLVFLAKGNEIFWAPGLGISDKIKVKNKVTHKLQFIRKEEEKA